MCGYANGPVTFDASEQPLRAVVAAQPMRRSELVQHQRGHLTSAWAQLRPIQPDDTLDDWLERLAPDNNESGFPVELRWICHRLPHVVQKPSMLHNRH